MMIQTTVIVPTVGTELLARCLESLTRQTRPCRVLVVVDGPQNEAKARASLPSQTEFSVLVLPWNVGGDATLGHRMYGAMPFFCKTKYVAFLDEDNWFDPSHIETMESLCDAHALDWSFSLRKVWCDGQLACVDNCESIGNLRKCFDRDEHLVDTSCYLVRTEVAVRVGSTWIHPHADRPVTKYLMQNFPRHACTMRATMNYDFQRDNRRGQKLEYFAVGNAALGGLDFEAKKTLYVHDRRGILGPYMSELRKTFNVMDASVHAPPPLATLVFCGRGDEGSADVPWNLVKRADLSHKVLVLSRPPRPSGGTQFVWNISFVLMFDGVIANWKTLSDRVRQARPFAFAKVAAEHAKFSPDGRTAVLLAPQEEDASPFVVMDAVLAERTPRERLEAALSMCEGHDVVVYGPPSLDPPSSSRVELRDPAAMRSHERWLIVPPWRDGGDRCATCDADVDDSRELANMLEELVAA